MKKLIELLNEYDEGGNWRKLHWIGLGCEDKDTIGYKDKELTCEQDEVVAYLISKRFGFIKWLVENDKIDTKKVAERRKEDGWSIVNYFLDEEQKTKETMIEYWVDNTLMALSISDTPIDDLISYLK